MAQPVTQRCGVSGDTQWLLAERVVAPVLRPYVRSMVGYVERTPALLRRRELPAPQCVLILELGPPIRVFTSGQQTASTRHRGGFIGGVETRYTITEYRGEQQGIQVNLTPIGARRLFGLPMVELSERVVALPDAAPHLRALTNELRDLPSWSARFARLEAVLGAAMRDPAALHERMVAWAHERIVHSGGRVNVGALARELGYSPKHLITMFRDQIGLTPGRYARLARFDALAQTLRQRGESPPWAQLALELGFADQAHLAHETRRFAGLTPRELHAHLRG